MSISLVGEKKWFFSYHGLEIDTSFFLKTPAVAFHLRSDRATCHVLVCLGRVPSEPERAEKRSHVEDPNVNLKRLFLHCWGASYFSARVPQTTSLSVCPPALFVNGINFPQPELQHQGEMTRRPPTICSGNRWSAVKPGGQLSEYEEDLVDFDVWLHLLLELDHRSAAEQMSHTPGRAHIVHACGKDPEIGHIKLNLLAVPRFWPVFRPKLRRSNAGGKKQG